MWVWCFAAGFSQVSRSRPVSPMSGEDSQREQQALQLAVQLLEMAKLAAKRIVEDGSPGPRRDADSQAKGCHGAGMQGGFFGKGKRPVPVVLPEVQHAPQQGRAPQPPLAKSMPVEGPRSAFIVFFSQN